MDKITIYHYPSNTYLYIEDLNEYMNKMKGNCLSYDISNNLLIDTEEIASNEEAILIEQSYQLNG